jgi:hypothetical protein
MPNNSIIKYVPGVGSCVIGYKVLDANVNFSYTTTKGVCPVVDGQTKKAKQYYRIIKC